MANNIEINEIIDDRYKISGTLGEGGMAIVFKGHDLISDKDVAIKVIKPDVAAKKENLNRFEREARAAASLNHPNIVKVLNVGQYKNLPYMVNEFINGMNLRQILDVRGRFSPLESTEIIYQLCCAISYAHKHGIIHRDIKPQNIFLSNNGVVKLGDFGVAVFQTNNHITKTQSVLGTPLYLAPELLTDKAPPSFQTDIYSIGVTFFELLTGRVPFDDAESSKVIYKVIYEKFPSIKKFNSKVPDSIEAIIIKATKKDPKERYERCDVMERELKLLKDNPNLMEKSKSQFFSLFKKKEKEEKQKKKNK